MESKFLLKDIYSPAFYDTFVHVMAQVLPTFDKALFVQQIFSPACAQMELKDRMRHTAQILHLHLPTDFQEASTILLRFVENCEKQQIKEKSIEFMFLPDYIEKFVIFMYW